MLPKFNRTAQACRKKFNQIFVSYKEDKLANGFLGNNRQKNKFYDALDQWYYQAGQVFKHVSATTNDNADFPTNSSPEVDCAPTSTLHQYQRQRIIFKKYQLKFLRKWLKLALD